MDGLSNSSLLMKRDRREWFANTRDGTGMVYVFTGSCGNGTGMEPVERDGTGLVFIFIPVSLSTYVLLTVVRHPACWNCYACFTLTRIIRANNSRELFVQMPIPTDTTKFA